MRLTGQPELEPRQRVLRAAMAAIAERGVGRVRMTHIAELAGMSSGHILYYFENKGAIFRETLRWSEGELAERWRAELARIEDMPARLVRFVEIYLPQGPDDPHWALWLEVHDRSLRDHETVAVQDELERVWRGELADIMALGVRRGEFRTVDADEVAERYCLLLDGLGFRLIAGYAGWTRRSAIERVTKLAGAELGFRPGAVPAAQVDAAGSA